MKNKRRGKVPIWQYLLGLFILASVLVFSFLFLLERTMAPHQAAKEAASQLARDRAGLDRVESFSIYNGKESYYSIIGQTKQQQGKAVLIARDANYIRVYDLSDGISQDQAEQIARENGAGSIDKTTFGYLDGQPVWEVKSGTAYYNIGFESKTLLSKEGL